VATTGNPASPPEMVASEENLGGESRCSVVL
jgi:hypothetical protein